MDIDCISSVSFLFPVNVYFCCVTVLKYESYIFVFLYRTVYRFMHRTGISLSQISVRALVFDLPEKV